MSEKDVTKYFTKLGIQNKIITLNQSAATVALAAQALNCEEKQIAKSLTFWLNDQPIMIVCAGNAKVDNKKFKETFGIKAKMLTPPEVETHIGHKVGGVCPFGIEDGVKVFLDESLKQMEVVYPSAGNVNVVTKLTIEELAKYSNFTKWVCVTNY